MTVYAGQRWVTLDGSRTILIERESVALSDERHFVVRTVASKHTQHGRLAGSRPIALSTLLSRYRREREDTDG